VSSGAESALPAPLALAAFTDRRQLENLGAELSIVEASIAANMRQRLRMIDLAEQELKRLGLREVRVRYHEGDHARIEVPPPSIPEISQPAVREPLFSKLRSLGFQSVEIDPDGFRSGSLNEVLPVEAVAKWSG